MYQKIATFKDYTTICSSAPSEILALIALRAKEPIIKRYLDRIDKNLKLADTFFSKHQDLFSWIHPKAGTIAFPKLNSGQDSYEFCEKAIQEAGIMLLPSTVYDYDNKTFQTRIWQGKLSRGFCCL